LFPAVLRVVFAAHLQAPSSLHSSPPSTLPAPFHPRICPRRSIPI
jgi:hypothetical protein